MQTQEFLKDIESAFLAEFPESFISIEKKSGLYHSVYIICHLGKPEEWAGKIRQNDPLHVMIQIDLTTGEFPKDHNNTDSMMPENLRMAFEHSYYRIKTESPYKYCEHKKAGGRLTKGDSVKILVTLKKYFKNVKASLTESLQNGEIMEKDMPLFIAKLTGQI